MSILASHLMQEDVLTVSPELSLIEAHRLFADEEISGAPVVDDAGRVVGVISVSDLIRAVQAEHETGMVHTGYFREVLDFSGPDWATDVEDFQDRLGELTVADAMSPAVVSVPPDATLAEVARALREHHIHRVLVSKDRRLEGIISTFDFVGLFV